MQKIKLNPYLIYYSQNLSQNGLKTSVRPENYKTLGRKQRESYLCHWSLQ